MLSHATSATERAKKSGGNTFSRFDATTVQSDTGRRSLLEDLRAAVERQELVLYFQPQVSLF